MKKTGFTRKVDSLGRIVIPIEIREMLGIQNQDTIEISVEENKIMLFKQTENCIFCGSNENLVKMKQKNICSTCINEMNSI